MLLKAFSEHLLHQEMNALRLVQIQVDVSHYGLDSTDAETSHIPRNKKNSNLQVLTFIWAVTDKLSFIIQKVAGSRPEEVKFLIYLILPKHLKAQ
jgi:hypothetical protein